MTRMEEKTPGRKAAVRNEAKGKRKAAREKPERVGRAARQDTLHAAWCRKGGNKNVYAMDEDDRENTEESAENEEDLQAWRILEESESEQWQEAISRRSKQRAKKATQASLSSVESSHNLSPKKIVEVKGKWVKVRVTMDSGAAGHVMLETMFPHVKLERKTSSKKFVAANGEQIKDLGEKKTHSRQTREFRGAKHSGVRMLSNPSFRCKRSSELETLLCWMKRIRTSETLGMEQ